MNGVLGERTPDKGYIQAGIIRYGRLAESYGGGISQVSTTIFNASFFAGVQLDAWQAHSFYISRYPEGREATISWPDLHNKWTNTLDGGILMEVTTTATSITVSYWGTKKYDVEATKSARYDLVQPKKITDDSPPASRRARSVSRSTSAGSSSRAARSSRPPRSRPGTTPRTTSPARRPCRLRRAGLRAAAASCTRGAARSRRRGRARGPQGCRVSVCRCSDRCPALASPARRRAGRWRPRGGGPRGPPTSRRRRPTPRPPRGARPRRPHRRRRRSEASAKTCAGDPVRTARAGPSGASR